MVNNLVFIIFFLPIWHPDGVRRVMGVVFCVTDVAPRWGAEGCGVFRSFLPIWHPDGVRRVMGLMFVLPMWHPDGVRRVMGLMFVLPMWHPDGVRRVMGVCVLCYRCGTPMGCGGLWGFVFCFTDVAPRWGAEGYGCLCFVLPMWHPDGVRRVMGVCVLCYRCGTPMGCDQLLSLNFYLLSLIS